MIILLLLSILAKADDLQTDMTFDSGTTILIEDTQPTPINYDVPVQGDADTFYDSNN